MAALGRRIGHAGGRSDRRSGSETEVSSSGGGTPEAVWNDRRRAPAGGLPPGFDIRTASEGDGGGPRVRSRESFPWNVPPTDPPAAWVGFSRRRARVLSSAVRMRVGVSRRAFRG